MVKHTKTIRSLPTNCLSVFDHFLGLALKKVNIASFFKYYISTRVNLFHGNVPSLYPLKMSENLSEMPKKSWRFQEV